MSKDTTTAPRKDDNKVSKPVNPGAGKGGAVITKAAADEGGDPPAAERRRGERRRSSTTSGLNPTPKNKFLSLNTVAARAVTLKALKLAKGTEPFLDADERDEADRLVARLEARQ